MHTIEVTSKEGLRDASGEAKRKEICDLGFPVRQVREIVLYIIDKELSKENLHLLGQELFTDPLTQDFSVDKPIAGGMDWDWLVHVKYLPGMKDNVGERAVEAIGDTLGTEFVAGESVYTSKYYLLKGNLNRAAVEKITTEVLGYASVESWEIRAQDTFMREGYSPEIPKVVLDHKPAVEEIGLNLADPELLQISKVRSLALNREEMKKIRDYFSQPAVIHSRKKMGLGQNPTDAELEVLAQTWSEHCKHKIFNARIAYREEGKAEEINSLFKTYICKSTETLKEQLRWVISTLWDNSGVMEFNSKYLFAFKCETHNSPSAKYPYGGAITGIVGVYRDPMGTGQGVRLIYGTYGFCTGEPNYEGNLRPEIHPKRLLEGVRKGVEHGGNKHGVPTPYGITFFHDGYMAKPAIYVLAAGLIPKVIHGEGGAEKWVSPGDVIVMCGGKVGIDGIHGATESSLEGGKHITLGHVQMGDPYTQKKMHDFLNEARDKNLYTCIQDNGAGGISSSVGEMGYNFGRKGGAKGFLLHLDRVPLKYSGLNPWQILVSESQERMSLAVSPEKIAEFKKLAKQHEVETTVLGEFTDSGKFQVFYKGKPVTFMDMKFVHEGVPQMDLEAEWISPQERGLEEPQISPIKDKGKFLKQMLAQPNIASKEYIVRQFDHEVQGTSVIKHLVGKDSDVYSDGVVVRPDLESKEAIAVTAGINPLYGQIDTYYMTANAFDEAVRRVIALGGSLKQIALNDNFCWPSPLPSKDNPEAKYKLAQLVRANRALYKYTLAYGTPCISGKDSMSMDGTIPYSEGKEHRLSALPTIQFSAAGKIKDYRKCVTMDVKRPGDRVFILGKTFDECGGSQYYEMLGEVGLKVPKVDAKKAVKLYQALSQAIQEGLVASAHGCYQGGLGVALAQVSFAGGYGVDINLALVPRENLEDEDKILYSESASRFVVTLPAQNEDKFRRIMQGNDCALVGKVTNDELLVIRGLKGKVIIKEDISKLKEAWKSPFK